MITEQEKDAALDLLDKFRGQQEHQVRDSVKNDCPTKEYEEGMPSGKGMCQGDGHYFCCRCVNYFKVHPLY